LKLTNELKNTYPREVQGLICTAKRKKYLINNNFAKLGKYNKVEKNMCVGKGNHEINLPDFLNV
jgi:hypothetical protein